ncbi:MAG: nucleotide exchange factor GrpE [Hamadaea sp.]|nr:nucleotide exchange factor GrpE [Hamadaea sp.]NUT17700.1 nucleotide exchange factor GrpE [Hamadaea sp.]
MGDAAGKGKPASQKDGATMPTPEDSVVEATEPTETPAESADVAATAESDASATSEAAATDGAPDASSEASDAPDAGESSEEADEPSAESAEAGENSPEAVTEPAPEAAPETSAAGKTATEDEDGSGALGAELEMLRKQLDEAQVDIKRVAAEYKNYRDRVKRDQAAAAEMAVAGVLAALLPVLDDLDRARDHGDLTGPFGSVAEQLLTVVGKFGLTAFGAKGDAFDPKLHEAVAHLPSPDVTEETCIDVMRRGYLLGDRLLRPAMVAVAAPE